MDRQVFNFAEEIEDVLRAAIVSVLNKKLMLKNWFPTALPEYVAGDAASLKHALALLFENAVQCTAEGWIDFIVHPIFLDDECVRIRFVVQDTGDGMTEDETRQFFSGSGQAPSWEDNSLGMASGLIERMGGRLNCNSQKGRGSRLWFDVELRNVKSHTKNCDAGHYTQMHDTPARLLLVESDEIHKSVICHLLDGTGILVDCVGTDKVKVMKALLRKPYDAILMDVRAPEMVGLDIVRQIRWLGGTLSKVPILALMAAATDNNRKLCLGAGMNEVLAKTIDRRLLLRVLYPHLKQKLCPPRSGLSERALA